jgi:hypothetical protein
MLSIEARFALETIIRESERLMMMARRSGNDSVARRLEDVLHEARTVFVGSDHAPPIPEPAAEGQSDSVVVPLRPPNTPRKPR